MQPVSRRYTGSTFPRQWVLHCRLKYIIRPAVLSLFGLVLGFNLAGAQLKPEEVARTIGFDQNLNAQVPLDLEFFDETGQPVKLGDYFGSKPVILTLVYFKCPSL